MIKAFDHVTITVSDLERSVDFYQRILGLEVMGMLEQNGGNFKIVYLDAGGAIIELFHFKQGGQPLPEVKDSDIGIKHIGFRVDNVDEVVKKLKEAGIRFTLEPFDATGGVRIAFFKDPDGILIELVQGELKLLPYEGKRSSLT